MGDAYLALLERIRSINMLNSVSALLGWDQELHMPPRGGENRAAQLALLSSLAHERFTSPELGEVMERATTALNGGQLPPDAGVNIRETKRAYDRQRRLPRELVEELAKTRSHGMQAWRTARQSSDFKIYKPWLEKHMELQRRAADLFGYNEEPYDALLEEYEPGMTAAQLEVLLGTLGEAIVPMVLQLASTSSSPDHSILTRTYPAEKQREWAMILAQSVGFNFESGRLDICNHAFTETVCNDDVRLTVRCNENDPLALTYSLLHEAGHGLYEQGVERKHQGTPMGQSVSLGVHESQSRLWENMVGRSRAFWVFALPRFKQVFAGVADDLDLSTAFQCANEVKPSLRRLGSDEITYNLHILLRFDLERKLINGQLRVTDLPGAWNAGMQKYLGLTPPNDAQGVLQDVHWAMYYVGYFPTYGLGNLYAAQIYEAALREMPDLEVQVAHGEFQPLREWLREKIHRHGMRYQAAELVERVTGRAPASDAFLNYLHGKYGVAGTRPATGTQTSTSESP